MSHDQSIYDRVTALISELCGVDVHRLQPETTLFGDLGVDGDDGWRVLEALASEFNVDMSECNPNRHFGPEACVPWAPIFWLILAFRRGTPEERAGMEPIRIADLVRSAEAGRWICG